MANREIRLAAAGAGIYLWQVADSLGISEFTLSRKLRRELSDEEKKKLLETIQKLAERRDKYEN